ncbi:NADH:ubiquinone reductase (Na(+)-transporting) subunit B [Candidatus Uabimicrobium sp. HlEnr_7]|uniref:NADH:ubiquinone reductase (Na(+)-transporting) subunit B n=1 Tax=Candidatus Uabimicrobium helgolandensis TaxID=3095367 RepID=UPI003557B07F
MKFLRNLLDKPKGLFEKGGKLEKLYPFYEAADTFLFTPGEVTENCSHVRDGIDLKRAMITVVMALTPCILMALYNTGLQANLALSKVDTSLLVGWRYDILASLGIGYDPASIIANMVHGALYFFPVFLVCNIVGGFWESLFAVVRKHEINEGFLVTGMLFPLILPASIPLWQVAVGISFGVVIGKEVFGGTGKNILNPALTARVFLFFAYPMQITGEIWVPVESSILAAVDGFSGATALAVAAAPQGGLAALQGMSTSWMDSFLGFVPGSMGETSTLACLLGAGFLIMSGIGSWRIMLATAIGMVATSLAFNALHNAGMTENPMFSLTPQWHFVLGSFAFATVFMATDPVSAAMTPTGKWIYGFGIGCIGIIVRSANPAYPEGWMLAILFMNVFAPLIDYFVMNANIKRRTRRYELAQ